ncbi:MAG: D-glycero-beta-D-manno-heptose 1-phosphate adenylyltransferase [Candidatus Omnitrophica bacterium]|nr:D-glycero-beta-D-manno-heptose 1-phosphate adenylyltransferase [Candidatus Omnitrophota bacterium]
MKKIKTLVSLSEIIKKAKEQKKIIVFTNGCFDLFHYGHLISLVEAGKHGDILIVGINSDSSIKKLKGNGRPVFSQKERAGIVCGLRCVDYCVVFNESTPAKVIKTLKPDIIAKGADYKKEDVVGYDFVEKYGGKIVLLPLVKGISTSEIIKKIKNEDIENN